MELKIDIIPLIDDYANCWSDVGEYVAVEVLATMNDSVALVQNRAMANAPVKTGTLRRSITPNVSTAGGTVTGIVGTNVPYAKFVHEGTAAHVILPRRRKALMWPGAAHPYAKVNHPGTTANPFLKRALAEQRSAVLGLWNTRLVARLRSAIGDCG